MTLKFKGLEAKRNFHTVLMLVLFFFQKYESSNSFYSKINEWDQKVKVR